MKQSKKGAFSAVILTIIILSLLLQTACSSSLSSASASERLITGAPSPSAEIAAAAPSSSAAAPSPSADTSAAATAAQAGASTPDVPEQSTAVDDTYFSDAAFMGNSLVDGFKLYSGLSTCDYYSATSMTVIGATSKTCVKLDNGQMGTFVQGLTQKPYGKIYILLGINEIGYKTESFIDLYGKMLDTIIAAQPDCKIYVMGLTPVSKAKSDGSDTFTMARVTEYNAALRQLAAQKGCYFLDLVSALAGPDGYLPADETSDGIHFAAKTYKEWLAYLKTHYV